MNITLLQPTWVANRPLQTKEKLKSMYKTDNDANLLWSLARLGLHFPLKNQALDPKSVYQMELEPEARII